MVTFHTHVGEVLRARKLAGKVGMFAMQKNFDSPMEDVCAPRPGR